MNNKKRKQKQKRMEIRAPDWWYQKDAPKGIYQVYRYSKWELFRYAGIGIFIAGVLAKLFFNRVWLSILFLPFLYGYLCEKAIEKKEEREKQLEKEFRDLLISVQASLQAGQSVENGFMAAKKDMEILYGKEADILFELSKMQKELTCNMAMEVILSDFGQRSQCQDILEFSQVFHIAKRCGGNIKEVMSQTVQVLEDNMAVRNELEIVLAQKKLEQKIMTAMPLFILIYLSITSRGFFDVMYESFAGNLIMAGCLVGYYIAYQLMKKIIRIRV